MRGSTGPVLVPSSRCTRTLAPQAKRRAGSAGSAADCSTRHLLGEVVRTPTVASGGTWSVYRACHAASGVTVGRLRKRPNRRCATTPPPLSASPGAGSRWLSGSSVERAARSEWRDAARRQCRGVDAQPQPDDLRGRRVLEQGLTRIEAFTEGAAAVLGNTLETIPTDRLTSSFRDFGVGTVTHVWGWKALPRRTEQVLHEHG